LAIPLLAKFAGERREPRWAPFMEAEIGSFVGAREVDGFSLRVVECRTSLCIMEIYSENQEAFRFGIQPPRVIEAMDDPFHDAFPEVTETYGEGTVTLVILRTP